MKNDVHTYNRLQRSRNYIPIRLLQHLPRTGSLSVTTAVRYVCLKKKKEQVTKGKRTEQPEKKETRVEEMT